MGEPPIRVLTAHFWYTAFIKPFTIKPLNGILQICYEKTANGKANAV